MKIVTKNYYQTIKEIKFEPAECVKKIYPKHKAGEKIKFLGIPIGKYKENVYDANDVSLYSKNWIKDDYTFDELIPINGYIFENYDTFISVCRLAYICIDGEYTYFMKNETFEKYLSVIKGRCSELGNSIYKTIILDDSIIY